jgi:dTDP-4-dehydrorhamnose reductase
VNILVTGGKWQLGQEIGEILLNGKSEIGEIDLSIKKSNITFIDIDELDISNFDKLKEYFSSHKFDIVVNCAAMTNVDLCETEQDLAFMANSIGLRNLAMLCEQYGSKLVHVSTDYVFSGDKKINYNQNSNLSYNNALLKNSYKEWDSCNPQTIYGKSKKLGEEYIKSFSSKYYIIRTSWLYGKYGNNFVKTMLDLSKKNNTLKVVDDQIGSPTNANDLAHHILKIILTENYGIYHCTGNGVCSWYDFAKRIFEINNIDIEITPCKSDEFPRLAKRPVFSLLDNMMLR